VVGTPDLIDGLVKFIYTVILSIAALLGLFIMPPVGILLLLYLRGFFEY
jgi:hypothetical protein